MPALLFALIKAIAVRLGLGLSAVAIWEAIKEYGLIGSVNNMVVKEARE